MYLAIKACALALALFLAGCGPDSKTFSFAPTAEEAKAVACGAAKAAYREYGRDVVRKRSPLVQIAANSARSLVNARCASTATVKSDDAGKIRSAERVLRKAKRNEAPAPADVAAVQAGVEGR